MSKQPVGNRRVKEFKAKPTLAEGMTCVLKKSNHIHFEDLKDPQRRIYLDSDYTLARHCQHPNMAFVPALVATSEQMDLASGYFIFDNGNIHFAPAPLEIQFMSEVDRKLAGITDADLIKDGWVLLPNRHGWGRPQTVGITDEYAYQEIKAPWFDAA